MQEIKLKGLSKLDMLKFKNLAKAREKIINHSQSTKINLNYKANEISRKLHPSVQYVVVKDIIKETDNVKTFILEPNVNLGTKDLAFFQAGQYISLKVSIGNSVYRRPYSISCSPKYTLDNNLYTITIKKVKNGIVSSYMFDKVNVGDEFEISGPTGEFYYQPLRDSNNIIALVEGVCITPIYSIAQAIFDGIIDANLTIFYENKTKNDIVFFEKLDDIICKTDKVKLIHVLNKDKDTEFYQGMINKTLLTEVMDLESSFFVCGSLNFYKRMNEILKELNISKKYVRSDVFMSEIELKDYEEYNLLVKFNNQEKTIKCRSNQTLLSAMESAGIPTLSKCHVGECGFCRSKLISGKVKTFDTHLRIGDRRFLYIHPCSTYPESDVVVELPF